jgi:tRNA pseudouridine55 synthase
MDGLLLVDKPAGPTSHDVVARMRRALGETRIGHTGTLDPAATGLLLLVLGKATRLATFLSASDKSYEAVVRLGFATDTADAEGRALGAPHEGALPTRSDIEAALEPFRGTFLQQPPAFSAKKIDGQRSYKLARDARNAHDARLKPSRYDPADLPDLPALPAPASVTAHAIRIVSVDGDRVTLSVDCSAGFYVRSLAHDLGERLGTGGHLAALRRTRSGDFTLAAAIDLDTAQRDPVRAAAAVVPMAAMLPSWPSVILTAEGITRVGHGQDIRPADTTSPKPPARGLFVRLLDARGDLLAIAVHTDAGLLHPSVVLV